MDAHIGDQERKPSTESDEPNNSVTTKNSLNDKQISSKDKKPKPFPSSSIRDCLSIAKVIKEHNAGNPWSTSEISKALGVSSTNSSLFYTSAASRDYGFTTGTTRGKVIELTALGRKFVYASSGQDEAEAVQKAFSNIALFKNVFEYYKDGKLPEIKYLRNTLIDKFDLQAEYHNEFVSIYGENIKYLAELGAQPLSIASTLPISAEGRKQSSNKTSGKNLFVIMPFVEKTEKYSRGFFDEVFSSLIVPAAAEAGYTAVTANKSGSDIIQATIVNDILDAEIIIADLTEHNPNVLFELGLAIAFEKKVALIRAKGTPQIFDVDNLLRVYDYDHNLWKSTIERDVPNLCKHILSTNEKRDKSYLELLKRG